MLQIENIFEALGDKESLKKLIVWDPNSKLTF
jgi:hypothetical protein